MNRRLLQLSPVDGGGKKIVKIRVRVTTSLPGTVGAVQLGDILVQAGTTATGWVPHVTEMPWMAGVVGG